ncbi:MAG: IS607 family transposase [Xenococcaceae cyanobacterium MO_188.B19]|nr:IS607 family transposase [Xenococcaceae cyanobacterium MO_188.B19]MDJ0679662.1 IS607 family transposase [Xenococcaceae cyanobacterium MO_167.B52]
MKYVTPKEASQRLGVAISTLRRWDKEGKIRSIRTPGGQRRFCIEEYEKDEKPIVLYARVSSNSQKDDLERQVEFLQSKYPEGELVKEIGSGLNFKRRRLLSILERIYKSDISMLVVAYSDRLVRFGFPLIEWLCQQGECKLLVLNERQLSPEQELVEDILAILHCFSSRLYGLRKYRTQVQKNIQEATAPPDEKVNTQQCQENQGISL